MDTMSAAPATPRVALVTGCSSGIGAATTRRLLQQGHRVWASARDRRSLMALEDEGCRSVALDLLDEGSVIRALNTIEARDGPVRVLVNNAGYGQHGPLELTSSEALRRQFEVNVFGPLALCRRVLPGMREAGGGRIVNVSSMGGRLSFPGGGGYHGSKYALEALSDVLRWEVAGFGVGVTVVEPGPVRSAFGEAALATLPPMDGPYAVFGDSLRAALEGSFRGDGLPGASTAEEVAEAIATAIATEPAPSRVVVGTIAEQMLAARAGSSDAQWDAFMDTLYRRPEWPSSP